MNKIVEVLTKAKSRIEDPIHWTKGISARDVNGNFTFPEAPEAAAWCSIGAIESVYTTVWSKVQALYCLRKAIQNESVSMWNDNANHAEVMNGFDGAIAVATRMFP